MNSIDMSRFAESTVSRLSTVLPIVEMRANRGSKYRSTNFYQIRVKPLSKDAVLATLLETVKDHLTEFSDVIINKRSVNSGKYSSVSFSHDNKQFDIVVARGSNKGESFEKELLEKMQALLIEQYDPLAVSAFEALKEVDPTIQLTNISSIIARTGKTKRSSSNITPSEAGAIIADIVINTKDGAKKFISVKNSSGATVANFGISKAFNDDLTVNELSEEYTGWLAPFGLDAAKINEGLIAARDKLDVTFVSAEKVCQPVPVDSPVYRIMEKMWGADYIYLREQNNGFKALNITKEYIDEYMLKDLVITEIAYPYKDRKQISVYLESATTKFKIEVRNTSGGLRPMQINMKVMKSVA
jgi:hypothetical protein